MSLCRYVGMPQRRNVTTYAADSVYFMRAHNIVANAGCTYWLRITAVIAFYMKKARLSGLLGV